MRIPAIVIQLLGIPSNLLVLVAILHIGPGSHLTSQLLSTQCIFDCLTCICALAKAAKPGRLQTNVWVIDSLLCYLWSSYAVFWFCVLLSMSNLAFTAFDRLCAIVYCVSYQKHQSMYSVICYTSIIVYSVILASINPLFLTYRDEKCMRQPDHAKPWITPLMKVDAVLWPLLTYLIPCLVSVGMYSKVIVVLRRHRPFVRSPYSSGFLSSTQLSLLSPSQQNQSIQQQRRDGLSQSKYARNGKRQLQVAQSLTIATFIMQAVFLITHAFDCVYYFLGSHNWIQYRVGSKEHLLGIWLITLNHCLNPGVLIFTMRPLRTWLIKHIFKFTRKPVLQTCNISFSQPVDAVNIELPRLQNTASTTHK